MDNDGFTVLQGDCDDNDPSINPTAQEIPDNNIDEDCDGNFAFTYYPDNDSDGFGAGSPEIFDGSISVNGYSINNLDCDDTNPSIFPGAIETPDNNLDNDCDGRFARSLYTDSDNDGFGDINSSSIIINCDPCNDIYPNWSFNNLDCDDTNPSINPAAQEIPDNDIDEDCNGLYAKNTYFDADGDGFGAMNATPNTINCNPCNDTPSNFSFNNLDCDDNFSTIFPGAYEIPGNGVIEDCNLIDDPVLSINEFDTSEFKIFPNPTSNYIYINFPKGNSYLTKVYSMLGIMLLESKAKKIDCSNFQDGVYILKIKDLSNNNNVLTKIIIKE